MAAVLSPDERTWLAGGFAHVRADGRGPADARPVAAAAGVLPAAAGSAEVRLGGTHVIVGVKLELEPPHPDTPAAGVIHVDVDVSPVAGPDNQSGRPRDEAAAELASSLERSLRGGLDTSALAVAPGVAAWHVYVDALLLAVDGGAPTALSLAAAAALTDARVPRVTVGDAIGGAPPDVDVDDDLSSATLLDVSNIPIMLAVASAGAAGGGGVVVDPDSSEDAAASAVARVAVAADGGVRGLALAKGTVTPGALAAMVALARRVAPGLRAATLRAAADAAAAVAQA